MRSLRIALLVTAVFATGYGAGRIGTPVVATAEAAKPARVFELRTYTTPEGKLDALNTRFRDHTVRIFKRHGMTSVGYWLPQDSALAGHTLVYILAHPSREAAARNWAAFRADPEWQKVAKESEANGRIVSKTTSVYMDPADYSAIR